MKRQRFLFFASLRCSIFDFLVDALTAAGLAAHVDVGKGCDRVKCRRKKSEASVTSSGRGDNDERKSIEYCISSFVDCILCRRQICKSRQLSRRHSVN